VVHAEDYEGKGNTSKDKEGARWSSGPSSCFRHENDDAFAGVCEFVGQVCIVQECLYLQFYWRFDFFPKADVCDVQRFKEGF
jgi:hypothetical protein